jgi:hypothetical protein
MKIREVIVETAKEYSDVHDDHSAVFSMAVAIPDIAGHYYEMYRAGVDVAGQSGQGGLEARKTPVGNNMLMMAYHPIEMEMIRATAKNMGHDLMHISPGVSREPDATHTTSPVRQRKRKQ